MPPLLNAHTGGGPRLLMIYSSPAASVILGTTRRLCSLPRFLPG
jgi:hypothetical protein